MSAARENGKAWPWLVAGATLGVAAGLVIGAELAHIDRSSLRRALRRFRTPTEPPVPPGLPVRAAREALVSQPRLAGLSLQVLPVRPGTVELHGWVSSRDQRTLAVRTVRAIAGIENVIDCLLVRGEDDLGGIPAAPADEEIS